LKCKFRCVNLRRVSDPRRAFQPAIGVTHISDGWYRTTIGVIATSLEIPRSAEENIGCIWEHLEVVAISLGAPATDLGALTTSLGGLATTLGAPRITVD
jgi:hypothetical protein